MTSSQEQPLVAPDADPSEHERLPDWWHSVLESVRGIGLLPRCLFNGWHDLCWYGRTELLLGAFLLLAFALSGHAAAVPAAQLWYALSVDLLHLVSTTAWVGGLLYIGVVLLPASFTLDARQRARLLALGLPQFSALAMTMVLLLAVTGSLNTTIHLTSFEQFLTTQYGRTLAVKIGLFLLMTVISAYHAFVLRPRLAWTLAQRPGQVVIPAFARVAGTVQTLTRTQDELQEVQLAWHVRRQAERMADWLQVEALIGVAVLLCVALLGAFAGTLAPSTTASNSNATGQIIQQHGPFVQTQHADGYTLTFQVAPASFGTNTFTVTLSNAQGQPVQGAGVLLETNMLDMDMGTQTTQLSAVPSSPGMYRGQSDLTMAGHWAAIIRVLPPNGHKFVQFKFTFSAV